MWFSKFNFQSCFTEWVSWDLLMMMPWDLTDDKSKLVQVLAWCRQAASHYLSQCWHISMLQYGVIRLPWVINKYSTLFMTEVNMIFYLISFLNSGINQTITIYPCIRQAIEFQIICNNCLITLGAIPSLYRTPSERVSKDTQFSMYHTVIYMEIQFTGPKNHYSQAFFFMVNI